VNALSGSHRRSTVPIDEDVNRGMNGLRISRLSFFIADRPMLTKKELSMRHALPWTSLFFLGFCAHLAFGQDTGKIDRRITKEPRYESKSPWYCLLLFGPEGKTKVWMVLDGKKLYVDRNANGDLTDDGESLTSDDNSFNIPDVGGKDGKTKYTDLRLNWGPSPVTGGDPEVNLSLRLRVGNLEQYAFVKARATKPDQAPVIHVDGPLQIELRIQPYKPQQHLTRGKEHLLGGSICTRYAGVEWVGVRSRKRHTR
jgi:hypothetical protein